MKKLALLLLTFVALSTAAFSAEIGVNGKLTTWAGLDSNASDFDSDGSDSVGYLYVNGELNTTVELADNVKVVLELELNDKVSNGNSMNSSAVGGRSTVEIDEAYLEISDFFMDMLTVKIGHQWMEYSLRSNHRAMLIADDFTAFKGTFKFEKGFLDVFYAKHNESLSSVNLSDDEDIFGVHVAWDFNENIHVIGYINYATLDNSGADRSNIGTIGTGVDYFLLDKKLELFLEIAFQFGDISEDVGHSGLGLDLGAKWVFPEIGSIKNLYVELNIGYRSGQDNDTDSTAFRTGWANGTGALIAEASYNRSSTNSDNPMYKGYVDDSYMAIRLETGANWTEKISSHLLIAFFDNTDEDAEPYGVEVDLSSNFKYSENVNMALHIAAFMPDETFGADADTVFALAFETTVAF